MLRRGNYGLEATKKDCRVTVLNGMVIKLNQNLPVNKHPMIGPTNIAI